MSARMLVDGPRCPRCGGTLITDGSRVWCSFVGGGSESPCVYGIGAQVAAPKDVTDDFDRRLAGSREPDDLEAARQQLAQERATVAANDLLAYDPAAPVGFVTAGASTSLARWSLEEIADSMERFRAETRRMDDDFAATLRDLIAQSKRPHWWWARMFRVRQAELDGILDGTTRPIPARFYDEARRVVFATQPAPT